MNPQHPSLPDLIPSLAPYLNGNGNSEPESSDSPKTGFGGQGVDSLSFPQTGPTSPDGKSAARLNSFKHGLDATDEIFMSRLQSSERSAYRKIRRTLYKFYSPNTSYETLLVDRMAIQHLRMLRLYRLESEAMDVITFPNNRGSIIPHLDRFSRYDVRIEKQLRILHNRVILFKKSVAEHHFKLIPIQE